MINYLQLCGAKLGTTLLTLAAATALTLSSCDRDTDKPCPPQDKQQGIEVSIEKSFLRGADGKVYSVTPKGGGGDIEIEGVGFYPKSKADKLEQISLYFYAKQHVVTRRWAWREVLEETPTEKQWSSLRAVQREKGVERLLDDLNKPTEITIKPEWRTGVHNLMVSLDYFMLGRGKSAQPFHEMRLPVTDDLMSSLQDLMVNGNFGYDNTLSPFSVSVSELDNLYSKLKSINEDYKDIETQYYKWCRDNYDLAYTGLSNSKYDEYVRRWKQKVDAIKSCLTQNQYGGGSLLSKLKDRYLNFPQWDDHYSYGDLGRAKIALEEFLHLVEPLENYFENEYEGDFSAYLDN